MTAARAIVAEAVGTALLAAAVIGSGIMAADLAAGSTALALLANTLATGAALVALIVALAPISGAHLNPLVTLVLAAARELSGRRAAAYVAAQVAGAIAGAVLANAMFDRPPITLATTERHGFAILLSEAVASFGLLGVVIAVGRRRAAAAPYAVAAYITAAYWFTASTSFANPAVTVGRSLSDTFTGIAPADVGPFIGAQLVGATLAALLFGWLVPPAPLQGQR